MLCHVPSITRASRLSGGSGEWYRAFASGPYSADVSTRELPTGTLTFLFTDIEGSTKLASALGAGFGAVLGRHHAILRAAFEAEGGTEVSTEGDAFFVVFRSASAAVVAAANAQRALAAEAWPDVGGAVRVRMGMHTGEGTLGGDNYVGLDVNRAARIANAAHGGQVLLSATTRGIVEGGLPGGLALRDLGEFRLKDLDRPERLAQLTGPGLVEDFPPPRTLETPTNLPPQVTGFIGREAEVEQVCELLKSARLVTLTGPGGTGKTRLSLRVAERQQPNFPGGVFFVELDTLTDADLVAPAIAHAIGLREDPKLSPEAALEAHLRDRVAFFVLDNLEQFAGGVPLVGRLLAAAPKLSVLATSREPLHLRGEQEFPVPPLGVPDPSHLGPIDALSQYDAVALFIQRARAVRPDFEVTNSNAPAVAEICARLDGLPLAIELAAARTKLFAPEAILARLEQSLGFLSSSARDLPERQRTLRGAIDWSYNLLEPAERQLFDRLAIFVGGWTAESAAAVCAPDGELGLDVVDALVSFVDRSLVVAAQADGGEPRFRMLETIREYALERLAESPDADLVRRRHRHHFGMLAKDAEPQLIDASRAPILDRLEAENDNVRAAILRAAEDGGIELALDTAAALWRFWQQRSHLAEGKALLEGLLSHPDAMARTKARGRAVGALGGVVYWQGDFPTALRHYNEQVAIGRELDDPAGLADGLYNAGFAATIVGDLDQGQSNYEEAIRIFKAAGDAKGLTRVREANVFLLLKRGAYAEARTLATENLEEFRRQGSRFRIANSLAQLGGINQLDGAYPDARAAFAEAIALFREGGDMPGVVRLMISAAAAANGEGDFERAARLRGAADELKAPLGDIALPMEILGIADPAIAARAALGDAAYEAEYEAGRGLSFDEITGLVQA
jgi:predicted ATPase/class 3 adenylate cyclase